MYKWSFLLFVGLVVILVSVGVLFTLTKDQDPGHVPTALVVGSFLVALAIGGMAERLEGAITSKDKEGEKKGDDKEGG